MTVKKIEFLTHYIATYIVQHMAIKTPCNHAYSN